MFNSAKTIHQFFDQASNSYERKCVSCRLYVVAYGEYEQAAGRQETTKP